MDNLLHNREILIAAIRELLGLAEEYGNDVMRRKTFIMEATRLSLRLLDVQKQIEDHDTD